MKLVNLLTPIMEAGENWVIVTPTGGVVGDEQPSETAAIAKWNTISDKNKASLKVIPVSQLEQFRTANANASTTPPTDEKKWYIVTSDGTNVGEGLPSEADAVAKWKSISEKNRTGLKIVQK